MYSLAKDLLFLHGHITRPEDLAPVAHEAPATREHAEAPAARTTPTDDAACGTC